MPNTQGPITPSDDQPWIVHVRERAAFVRDAAERHIRADAMAATQFFAPNTSDPSMLDLASVSGYIGLVKTGTDAEIPTVFLNTINGDGTPVGDRPEDGGDFSGLLDDFVTGNPASLRSVESGTKRVHEVDPRTLGDEGRVSCFIFRRMRRVASRYLDAHNTEAQIHVGVTFPVRELRFDLLLHRDLVEAESVAFAYNAAGTPWEILPAPHHAQHPIGPAHAFDPATEPPFENDDRYAEAVRHAAEASDWSLDAFLGLRLVLRFPAPGSTLTASYPLVARP